VDDVLGALYLVLLLAGPVAGFAWALRRGRPRAQAVVAAALGGAVPGALAVAAAAASAVRGTPAPGALPALLGDLLPYPLLTAAAGAGIGLCGLLARALGAWLARRP
jgi:hypothetical protein